MAMTATSPVLSSSSVVERDLHKLREASGKVVGSVFYGTLLRSMRDSSLKGEYGHGGRGEEVFAAQLDGIMAEEMGQSTSGGLADVLFKTLEHQQTLVSELRAKH